MEANNQCPKCKSPHIYEDRNLWVCPECAYEWSTHQVAEAQPEEQGVKDAFGNLLATGDTITVIKELRIKGSTSAVKVGTKVKNIRIMDAGDGHDIACKIDGIGSINLKSEFVKKV